MSSGLLKPALAVALLSVLRGGVGRTKCCIFVEGAGGCDLAHPSSGGGALPDEGAGHCV